MTERKDERREETARANAQTEDTAEGTARQLINVFVNGQRRSLPHPAAVADLLAEMGLSSGVAVAVNQQVIPRSLWATTPLATDDLVEVIRAVQGG
jgi:sulfur carrier protein